MVKKYNKEMFYERLLIVYLQLEYWRRNILLDIISYVNKKACLLPQSMSSEAMHLNFSFINTKSPILFNGFKKYLNFILFLNLNSVEKLKCELNYDSNPNTYSITCKLLLSLFFIICSNLLYM